MENQPDKVNPQERERLMSFIKIMSAIALALGVVSIIVGILVFVYHGGGGYPVSTGVGIWYAFMPIGFGILGLVANFSTDEKTQRNTLNGHYVMSILMLSMGYALAASIQGLVTCSQKDAKCGSNPDEQIALHAILVADVVVGYFISITSMVLHLKNKSILHPDWKYRKGCCGKVEGDK
uniref:Uncharacterized protein LOC111130313 n=1 Tax=Crassostrea virginica TaxID=6565 RepID=A0A8B8DY97_CRAVI|nr:uncharacterized protein LOC111130313 [Crassostrea virginica]